MKKISKKQLAENAALAIIGRTATTKETTKGVRIVDKETQKDLTGLLFKDKWEAAQYWHETHKTHGEYTTYEV